MNSEVKQWAYGSTYLEFWKSCAASALTGAMANPNSVRKSQRDLAHWSASVADSMMAEFEKRVK